MNDEPVYLSHIPPNAEERVIEIHSNGAKQRAEYWLDGEKVGLRDFSLTGAIEVEWPIQNGALHGVVYHWFDPNILLSAEPHENGLPHGTAREWGRTGRLLGTYTLEHGTGIDLWWEDWEDGSSNLAEVHFMKDGQAHGWEWWFSGGGLWWERHWHNGTPHGIERKWNDRGGLHRGFPRYYVSGERRTKAQYGKAAASDPTLPPSRLEDNRPQRTFPPEVARHLALPTAALTASKMVKIASRV